MLNISVLLVDFKVLVFRSVVVMGMVFLLGAMHLVGLVVGVVGSCLQGKRHIFGSRCISRWLDVRDIDYET